MLTLSLHGAAVAQLMARERHLYQYYMYAVTGTTGMQGNTHDRDTAFNPKEYDPTATVVPNWDFATRAHLPPGMHAVLFDVSL